MRFKIVFCLFTLIGISFCDPDVDRLKVLLSESSAMITRMEGRLERFEMAEKAMLGKLINMDKKLKLSEEKENNMKGVIDELKNEIKAVRNHGNNHEVTEAVKNTRITSNRRQLQATTAFTAYLDHVVKDIGQYQPIVYNAVILNDNNAYSNNTGIFRAPVPGLYLFSWSVTARDLPGTHHRYDVWSFLMINGVKKLSAVAESQAEADDNQGSSTAVVRLSAGDEVWTAHSGGATEVYGSSAGTTSFTGLMLYELEF